MITLGELHQVTSYDGQKYELNDAAIRFVVSTPGDLGLPPIEYQTRKPYKSDGLIEKGWSVGSRVFSLDIYINNDCGRDTYWGIRNGLLDVLRPNRNGPCTYTLIRSDGSRRAIKVRSLGLGIQATPTDEWVEWSLAESLEFEAFDPAWYDPSPVSSSDTAVAGTAQELSFPLAFDNNNIYFEVEGQFTQRIISYTGTWHSYPVITIGAPFTYAQIVHIELGIRIAVVHPLTSGTLTVDLDKRTFLSSSGEDFGPYLTADSDLMGFRIEPDPVASGGVNTLNFILGDAVVGSTSVAVDYYNRYIGI